MFHSGIYEFDFGSLYMKHREPACNKKSIQTFLEFGKIFPVFLTLQAISSYRAFSRDVMEAMLVFTSKFRHAHGRHVGVPL